MKPAPNILLHSPVSDESVLEQFVEDCLRDGVDLIAVWGPDCEWLHDTIDELVVGDGSDNSRFIMTSWHDEDTLEEAREFVAAWRDGETPFREIKL